MNFDQSVKKHMSAYRLNHLKVNEKGLWNGREYGHILPERLSDLNILEEFRATFTTWRPKSGITCHKGFHHLNSSQAACINLFFPPAILEHNQAIFALLGINGDDIVKWEFEKEVEDGTNFDFYLELKSGAKVYLEFKYTENGFGTAKSNRRRRAKLQEIYKPALAEKVVEKYLMESQFFKNYQLLRNLVYFRPGCGDLVVFMYPKANEKLSRLPFDLEKIIPHDNIRKAVKIRYLEDAVNQVIAVLERDANPLSNHFEQYREKYLLLCTGDK